MKSHTKAKQKNNTAQFARQIISLAQAKKAQDILLIDLRKQKSVTDFFVICTGSSDTHVKAISDAILDGTYKLAKAWHVEGLGNNQWILIDFVDVVVHIFHHEARKYYQIERLWLDAAIKSFPDDYPSSPHVK